MAITEREVNSMFANKEEIRRHNNTDSDAAIVSL